MQVKLDKSKKVNNLGTIFVNGEMLLNLIPKALLKIKENINIPTEKLIKKWAIYKISNKNNQKVNKKFVTFHKQRKAK